MNWICLVSSNYFHSDAVYTSSGNEETVTTIQKHESIQKVEPQPEPEIGLTVDCYSHTSSGDKIMFSGDGRIQSYEKKCQSNKQNSFNNLYKSDTDQV